tara:strand:+ start:172 stop:540 length:369 start_codon:yes stop_codon:yes gene_type:complete
MSDEKIYQRVQDELDGKPRKFTDKALMTKAEILSEGDEKKIKYTYMKLRVEKLKNEEAERLKREEKKEQERLKREEERLLQQAIDEENANKSTSTFKLILYALGIAILARIFVINFSDFFFG